MYLGFYLETFASKVAFFFWTIVKERLLTIDLLQRRGMIILNACPICLKDAENVDHIFIYCRFDSEISERFLTEIHLSWVFPNRMVLLLALWNMWKVSKKGCILWKSVCSSICWLIWLEHNKSLFESCLESAFNIFCKARQLACFGGMACNHLGDYSVANTKRNIYIISRTRRPSSTPLTCWDSLRTECVNMHKSGQTVCTIVF